MLTLLSYNILFGQKLDKIINWLLDFEKNNKLIDIFCFQEFPEKKIAYFLEKLKKNNHFNYQFIPTIHFNNKEFGQLTVFNSQKLELITHKNIPLAGSRLEKHVLKLFKKTTNRNSLLTILESKNNKKQFLLANIHLTCISLNHHRIKQLVKTLKEIAQFKSVLLVGDFNYTSLLPRISLFSLMKKNRFENATKKMKTHRLLFLRQQVDYIFYRNIQPCGVFIKKIKFSDHYPIIAKFKT